MIAGRAASKTSPSLATDTNAGANTTEDEEDDELMESASFDDIPLSEDFALTSSFTTGRGVLFEKNS